MNGYTKAMRRYFEVSGRSSRSEYWVFVLVYLILGIVAAVIDAALFSVSALESVGILGALVTLVHFIPSITVGIRRLHDTDRSGWWLLLLFIPLIGVIWLIVLFCFEGTQGTNSYGPLPD
jgi:uncharacterized membrane protein YhaH (DUF805 family)